MGWDGGAAATEGQRGSEERGGAGGSLGLVRVVR